MTTIPCPRCKGTGLGGVAWISRSDGALGGEAVTMPCSLCLGTKQVSVDVGRWVIDGESHRKARVAEGISIHERAAALGITPARLSAMENGRADPAMLEELE